MSIVNLFDLRDSASKRIASTAWDYYRSGARDELTLSDNRAAWERIRLRPRVLVDVTHRDTSTTLLGHALSLPVIAAPTAFQRLAHRTGELGMVRATGRAGTIMTLSSLATTAMEEVCDASTGPVWFQLYVYKDRAITRALVDRARAAGCTALVVTVDAPVLGHRERDVRNGFGLPPGLSVSNVTPYGLDALAASAGSSGLAAYVYDMLCKDLTWDDIDALAAHSGMPVLVKGVLRGDDAVRAADHGAAGVVVSNHGGRQLDTAIATADALPEIVAAVDGSCAVLVDGGIRRGTDVVKAIAMGADAVLMGRPLLWGLGHDGEDGALLALNLIREELLEAMALCGAPTLADLTPDLLAR
jgi:4-hydroxymandelate oxidase